ncbi:TonB-dependent receptor plug domain-containing protein [Flagellimonas sp. 2504JD4-2]
MKHTLLTVFLCFCFLICSAQSKHDYRYGGVSLQLAINDLEEKHKVSFSYAPDLIKGKTINLQIDQIELPELLNILEAQSGLIFKQISKNQITVSPQPVRDKVCGYLLEIDSRTPLPYASVTIDSIMEIATDAKGFFVFEGNRKTSHSLKVLGFETILLESSQRCTSIYLTPTIEALKEVVVTGYITSGIDKQKDGSIEVTQSSLGILPGLTGPDILQSVQLVPGISTLDESASGIQIRGGSPDQNLILFDGIKLFNTGYFYGMFSRFNPYATERATLFKSGTSASYGDRISGIIDISSGTEIPNNTKGGFGVDGLSLDGYIKAPLSKKTAVYLFARHSYTDLYKSPAYDGYAEKIFRNGGVVKDVSGNILNIQTDDEFTVDSSTNDFSFYDINSKIIYNPTEKDQITISGLFTRNALDFSFTSLGEQRIDSLVTQNHGISVGWEHKKSNKQKGKINAYYSHYDSYYRNQEFLVTGNVLEETNIRSNEIADFGLDLTTYRTINKNHSYFLGYQVSHTNNKIALSQEEPFEPEGNINLPSDESNLKNAVFGQYAYKTNNSGIFTGGIRLVHYSSVGKVFVEPRLNFEHPFSKTVRAKVSLERRNQPISQLVEFNQTELRLENNLWRLSDETIYPLLQSNQVSAGFLFDKNGWTLDLDGYYKRLIGLTSYTNGFSTPQLELSEGKSTIIGVDFLLKKRIQDYRIWIGYSFNDIKFDFSEIQLMKFRGNNDITHSLRISNSLKLNNLQFSMGWQYRSGEPFTPIVGFNNNTSVVEFGPINSARLRDYHRLDASATYNFTVNANKNHLMQLGLSALNIYNRKIPISIIYRADDEGNGLELKQVVQRFSLGFTPNIAVRWFFD